MDATAKLTSNAPGVTPVSPSASAGGYSNSGGEPHPDPAGQYRLVIEESSQGGRFIYKTVDRETGEVVRQLPREKLVEILESGAYASGTVIDTNV